MEAEDFASIPSVVPADLEAYARVFHPVGRDRPRDTKTWQGVDETTYFHRLQDIETALETEQTTWTTAAASFGTTMHAEAQYARLVRRDNGETEDAIATDGWRYSPPLQGCLDAASLSALSVVLARLRIGRNAASPLADHDGAGAARHVTSPRRNDNGPRR